MPQTGLFQESKDNFDKEPQYWDNVDVTDKIWFFFDVEDGVYLCHEDEALLNTRTTDAKTYSYRDEDGRSQLVAYKYLKDRGWELMVVERAIGRLGDLNLSDDQELEAFYGRFRIR